LYLSRLILTNFRNYSRLEWEACPTNNIVYGGNGQGKTNLLEAVYFLATTRSHRTSHEKELINWAASQDDLPVVRVEGDVCRNRDRLHLELSLLGCKSGVNTHEVSPSSESNQITGIAQKKILLNGIPRRAADIVGQIGIVLFTSQDIDVIGGAPLLRRRHMDNIMTQTDSRYLRALANYNRVVEQRNHLLRLIQENRASSDQLEFWNGELIKNGTYLIKHRYKLVKEINLQAPPIHRALTSDEEDLKIVYLPNLEGISPSSDEEEIKQRFAAKLTQHQSREIGAGISLIGPHRDDLTFLVNGTNTGIYGSRGQQRTLALSLKLAEAKFLLKTLGESPIILLDDMLSELDSQRCGLLIQALTEYGQVIITATELDHFDPGFLATAKVFQLKNGAIRSC
jgi:DNA replication and repair protein RecF